MQFTNPYWWTGEKTGKLDASAATVEITRRFLGAYGPATYRDFARWWGGASMATVRKWIASLADEATAIDLEGVKGWMLARDARSAGRLKPLPSVRLLPAFDPHVIGASPHAERLLPGVRRARVYRAQGWVSPVLLVDGFMQGIWRHEIKGSRVEVAIEPFVKIPASVRRAAGEEAERLAKFLGCKLTVEWNTGNSSGDPAMAGGA